MTPPDRLARLDPVGRVPDDLRAAAPQRQAILGDQTGDRIRYVILDCSGTTMDRYVDAPALVFVKVFAERGVALTMAEARVPMGLRKDLHIQRLLELDSVRTKWRATFGREPTADDAAALFQRFVPLQLELLGTGAYSELLPGAAEVTRRLQASGIKLGVTTGFTRAMLDVLLAGAAPRGFTPDVSVAGDEVESARPKPFMVLKNLERLGVLDVAGAMRLTVKVDDTVSGAAEGMPLCWSVAVSRWGNYVADSWEAVRHMSEGELAERERAAKDKLVGESGAHYVIDDLRDLPAVVADIERRLAAGEGP